MAAATAPGGYAILSGLLNDQAAEVLAAYEAAGFQSDFAQEIGEWSTLTLKMPQG